MHTRVRRTDRGGLKTAVLSFKTVPWGLCAFLPLPKHYHEPESRPQFLWGNGPYALILGLSGDEKSPGSVHDNLHTRFSLTIFYLIMERGKVYGSSR